MAVIPNLKQLKKGMLNRLDKENLVYKIIIDVIGKHLKENQDHSLKVRT